MGNEIWRVTCRFLSDNTVSPKNVGHKNWPLCDVAVASLYKRVVNGLVRMLDNAVRLGIVCGYADVANVVLFCEPVEGGDERCAIVRDDLFESSPSA